MVLPPDGKHNIASSPWGSVVCLMVLSSPFDGWVMQLNEDSIFYALHHITVWSMWHDGPTAECHQTKNSRLRLAVSSDLIGNLVDVLEPMPKTNRGEIEY